MIGKSLIRLIWRLDERSFGKLNVYILMVRYMCIDDFVITFLKTVYD